MRRITEILMSKYRVTGKLILDDRQPRRYSTEKVLTGTEILVSLQYAVASIHDLQAAVASMEEILLEEPAPGIDHDEDGPFYKLHRPWGEI